MTEAQSRVFEQRFIPLMEEFFQCWEVVAYDHDGNLHVSTRSHNRMESNALQEGMREVFRESEEPIPVITHQTNDEDF